MADLVVIFGNHIVIFSDKSAAFCTNQDLNVNWGRWYRSAVRKSAFQLVGARNWLMRYPKRIFRDRKCCHPFPYAIPNVSEMQFHLVAVTNGSYDACRAHFGGASLGSLLIDTSLRGDEHLTNPFRIGHVLSGNPFIHVLDEFSMNVVLREMDTISDFVDYLAKREKLLSRSSPVLMAAGEEQLVAVFLSNSDTHGGRNFGRLEDEDADSIYLDESHWEGLSRNPKYRAKKEADRQSYAWDSLLEYTISHVPASELSNVEVALRILASETRFGRRQLGRLLLGAMNADLRPGERLLRVGMSACDPNVAYVFLILPVPPYFQSYEEYREARKNFLSACCKVAKLKLKDVHKVIGIVTEPLNSEERSEDLMLLNVSPENWGDEQENEARDIQQKFEILVDEKKGRKLQFTDYEFPAVYSKAGMAMSPAKRLVERERERNLRKLEMKRFKAVVRRPLR